MPCIHITPNNHQMRSRDYSQSHLLLGACSHLPDRYYTPLNSVDMGETHNVPTNYDATCNIRMMTPRDYCGVREARQGALSLRSLDYCQSSNRNVEETSAVNSRCCTEPISQPAAATDALACGKRTNKLTSRTQSVWFVGMHSMPLCFPENAEDFVVIP